MSSRKSAEKPQKQEKRDLSLGSVLNDFGLHPSDLGGKSIGAFAGLAQQLRDAVARAGLEVDIQLVDREGSEDLKKVDLLLIGADSQVGSVEEVSALMQYLRPNGQLRLHKPARLAALNFSPEKLRVEGSGLPRKEFSGIHQRAESQGIDVYMEDPQNVDFWEKEIKQLPIEQQRILLLKTCRLLQEKSRRLSVETTKVDGQVGPTLIVSQFLEKRRKLAKGAPEVLAQRLEYIERNKDKNLKLKGLFGQELLVAWDELTPAEQAGEEIPKKLGRAADEVRRQFEDLSNKPELGAYSELSQLVHEASQDPSGRPALDYVGVEHHRDASFLMQRVKEAQQTAGLPIEFFVVLAKLWKRRIQPWIDEPPQLVQPLKNEFKKVVTKFLKDKKVSINVDVLERIVDEIPILRADPLVLGAHGGEMHAEEDVIFFGTDPEARHIVFHELFHAISGIQKSMIIKDEGGHTSEEMIATKVGLDFENGRFTWLNEAITEDLTNQSFGTRKVSTKYTDFIRIKRLFLAFGKQRIPEDLVLRAYFEDESVDAWRAFSQAVRKAYSDGFLVRLGQVMQAEKYQSILHRAEAGEKFEQVVEDEFRQLKK